MLYVSIKFVNSWGKNCAAPCVHLQNFVSKVLKVTNSTILETTYEFLSDHLIIWHTKAAENSPVLKLNIWYCCIPWQWNS